MAKKFRAKFSSSGLTVTVDTYDEDDNLVSSDLEANEVGGTQVYSCMEPSDTAVWGNFKPSVGDNIFVYESFNIALQNFILGDGDTPVNHNTGGSDNLSYKLGSAGIDNATVTAYVKSEYDSGILTVRGKTYTNALGRWVNSLYLNSGITYVIIFEKPGVYGPNRAEVTP
ncbi:MAG: hypothetical protein M0R03_03485 [Novosphingobium sp.]|nr:hypothetical protein [Novosphingobium sp.]